MANIGSSKIKDTYQGLLHASGGLVTLGDGFTPGTLIYEDSVNWGRNGGINEFGQTSSYNNFGPDGYQNIFGGGNYQNFFGSDANVNTFGSSVGSNSYNGGGTMNGAFNFTNSLSSPLINIGNNIVTETGDFTLSETGHAGKYIRLNKPDATQLITVSSSVSTGREFYFFKASSQAITFSGVSINGVSRLSNVTTNSPFALKCISAGVYDFI
jgi:hypothetical protein